MYFCDVSFGGQRTTTMAALGLGILTSVFLLVLTTTQGLIAEKVKQPSWGQFYYVEGLLQLPYAEIKEPFKAWYNAKSSKSRIDYYGDSALTFQRADEKPNGNLYKIVYWTNDAQGIVNERTCFKIPGSSGASVSIQAALPDVSDMQMIGRRRYNGVMAQVWRNVTQVGAKKNTYILYVSDDSNQAPIRYEMRGFDSLFGSHYDRYYMDYKSFANKDPPADSVFDIPSGYKCHGFPGPGAQESMVRMNPMSEYVSRDDTHLHEMFDRFVTRHGKEYKTSKESRVRKDVFRQTVRFIHSTNRRHLSYRVGINHLADLTHSELKALRGRLHSNATNHGLPFDKNQYKHVKIPDSIDWRLYGAVTPVKDQAVCGSCWSFGTTGTIEGTLFLKTGRLVRLSQQELMDCSWGEGNNACDGGEEFRSYEWIMKHGGIASEESYGPYQAQDMKCRQVNATAAARITSYVNVTSGDEQALLTAIAVHGPISVGIDAAHKSLSFYSSGVYYEPKCGNKPDQLDHAVLAVGFGTILGEPYWLIKNSWSTYWGNSGYVLISRKDNNCGVATAATFVNM